MRRGRRSLGRSARRGGRTLQIVKDRPARSALLMVGLRVMMTGVAVSAQAPASGNAGPRRRADQRAADETDGTEHQAARGAAEDAVHDRLTRAGRRGAEKDHRQSEKKSAHASLLREMPRRFCGGGDYVDE